MALAPWFGPAVIAEYIHNAGVRVRRQLRGHTRHLGNAATIVGACVEACWNGRTFTASPGHFDMFWTRDLCFSVPSLVRLGHVDRVHDSLEYALDVWTRRRSLRPCTPRAPRLMRVPLAGAAAPPTASA